MKLSSKSYFILFLLATGVPVLAEATDPPLPLPALIQKVIARDEANQAELKSLEYFQTLKTERLDEHDQVTKRQELQMVVRPGSSPEIVVLSEKGDDLPTDPDQASLQAQGQKAQSQKVDFSLKNLVSRFTVSLQGKDTIHDQPAYVLAFEPKPDQPYNNQTEKVLNHLRGRIWIRVSDYTVLRTEASLSEPVEVAWIFASITKLDFHYELEPISGAMGPAHIQTLVKVDAPLLIIRQRMTVDITRFESRRKTPG